MSTYHQATSSHRGAMPRWERCNVDRYATDEPRVTVDRMSATWSRRPDGTVRVHVQRLDAAGRVREVFGADAATVGNAWQWLGFVGIISAANLVRRDAFLAWLTMGRVDLPAELIARGSQRGR